MLAAVCGTFCMSTDLRLTMARELGCMLAVTARWRQEIKGPAPFIMYRCRCCDVRFRPRIRIIRSLDTRAQARGRATVRFASPFGRNRSSSTGNAHSVHKNTGSTRDDGHPFSVDHHVYSITGARIAESGYNTCTPLHANCDRYNSSIHSLPDAVVLVKKFVERLSEKLATINSEMILCSDEIMYVHELITNKRRRALQCLIYRYHCRHILLSWPPGWIFTFLDATRSPRLQKTTAAVLRDGHVCCDRDLLAIGVVHDLSREPCEAEYPVILINFEGFVYLYDDGGVVPVLHLLTKCGFSDFCRRGLRDRHGASSDLGSTPVDYTEEPLKSLLDSRLSINELVAARDRLLGQETAIFHSDDMWTFLQVTNLSGSCYTEEDFDNWREESGHLRLEAIFIVKACVSGIWVKSPVLVSDTGAVFYVDPNDGRVRFLSSDLFSFLVLGVMRFRNNNCFLRGTFPQARVMNVRPGGGIRPLYCPRGQRCRYKRVTVTGRVWGWLRNTWGYMWGCCRG